MLGLGDGDEAFQVKQLGIRPAQRVCTFNVAKVNGKCVVVLLNYEAGKQFTQACLLARSKAAEGRKLRGGRPARPVYRCASPHRTQRGTEVLGALG